MNINRIVTVLMSIGILAALWSYSSAVQPTTLGDRFQDGKQSCLQIGYDGTNYQVLSTDSSGNISSDKTLSVATGTASSSGDNHIINPGGTNSITIYRYSFSPSADLTGQVIVNAGGTSIDTIRNPKAGSVYGGNLIPYSITGPANGNVIITLPSATATDYSIFYKEE